MKERKKPPQWKINVADIDRAVKMSSVKREQLFLLRCLEMHDGNEKFEEAIKQTLWATDRWIK